MKLILAIVNDSDVKALSEEMMRGGFMLTKIGSTGGLLKSGVTTLLSCVASDRVSAAVDIIKVSTHSRKYAANAPMVDSSVYAAQSVPNAVPNEIVVGGATVFVLNVEENYKF